MKKLIYILLFVPVALFGQDNYSLSFDGVNDYVELGILSPFNQNESLSLEVKFKWSGVLDSQGQYILQFAQNGPGNITISMDNNGQLKGGILQCNCEADYASYLYYQIEPNEWYHVIYSYETSNGDSKLWVNNNLVGEGNYPFNSYYNINNSPSRVGNYHFNSYHFNGNIAYAQIVNDVLQPSPSSSPHENAIGCWDFNEGSGTTLVDLSGNGNHGVINGAIYSDDVPEQNSDDSNEVSIIDQLNQSFDAWNVSIDLSSGWNMFGYGCPSSIDVAEGLSNHTESISITKDNNGNVYMPEFSFNGIGNLTPGFGYQIKLTEAIEGFSLCDWYVNDIPEDNIVSLQDSLQLINSQIGCADSLACNFDITKLYDDGSCEYAEQGYDCESNITDPFIGMDDYGGIIFYIDESGQHGLVAALEDLEGAYEWGCYQQEVNGADGTYLGTGHQNTIDIVNQGCATENGGITAAQAVLYTEINGYSDWYIPSKDELVEMYNTIGNGGSDGNVGNFINNFYWSSSEYINEFFAWVVNFNDGWTVNGDKYYSGRVRVIRSF